LGKNVYRYIMADGCFPNWSVYIIKCKDTNNNACYVGKTNDFRRRKYQHKHLCNNPKVPHYNYRLYQLIREWGGWDNFDMIEVKGGLDGFEASELERKLYIDLNPYMNTQYPGRTFDEYMIDNKEKIAHNIVVKKYNNQAEAKERWTKNNERRRETINKQMREHYHKNKEKIQARDKLRYTCICGANIRYRQKRAHIRTAAHKEGARCFAVSLKNVKKDILRL